MESVLSAIRKAVFMMVIGRKTNSTEKVQSIGITIRLSMKVTSSKVRSQALVHSLVKAVATRVSS